MDLPELLADDEPRREAPLRSLPSVPTDHAARNGQRLSWTPQASAPRPAPQPQTSAISDTCSACAKKSSALAVIRTNP
jgi:hypothetical protein